MFRKIFRSKELCVKKRWFDTSNVLFLEYKGIEVMLLPHDGNWLCLADPEVEKLLITEALLLLVMEGKKVCSTFNIMPENTFMAVRDRDRTDDPSPEEVRIKNLFKHDILGKFR